MNKQLHQFSFMKLLVYFSFAVFVFASCNSKSNLDANKDVIPLDTASLYNSSTLTDTGTVVETSVVPKGKLPAYTRTGSNGTRNNGYSNTGTNTTRSSGNVGSGTTSSSSGSGQTTTVRRKGWSKAAKGTVIGAGTGAIAGAILSRNKGKGAIIGGVVGAAGGYIIGRGKDRKDGRVVR